MGLESWGLGGEGFSCRRDYIKVTKVQDSKHHPQLLWSSPGDLVPVGQGLTQGQVPLILSCWGKGLYSQQ